MKQIVKRSVQAAVAAISPAVLRWREPVLVVLMYHRVLPGDHPARESEQPGMYVSPANLATHLDVLAEFFQFIHVDDWLSRRSQGAALPARACAITFDDGWRDNYDHAYPILRRKGVPATIYLVSDLVGTTYDFWPNIIARALAGPRSQWPDWLSSVARRAGFESRGEDSADLKCIDQAINELKATRTDAEMQALVTELTDASDDLSSFRDLMNWSEVAEMASDGLIVFGSHTRTHTRLLPQIHADEMRRQIVGSVGVIQDRLGYRPRTFCYPNGDYCPEALKLVRSAYQGAVTTRRGWNHVDTDSYKLLRVGVHEDVSATRTSFLSRLIGVG